MTSMNKVFSGYYERKARLDNSGNRFAKGIAYVQGSFVRLADARVPLLDEGFMHSDLTYDVPSVWDGRFFRLDDHLSRLEDSCEKMRLKIPLSRDEVKQTLREMVAKSGIEDAFVELIVTRGLKGVRGNKPEDLFDNHLYLIVMPYVWVMEPAMQPTGVLVKDGIIYTPDRGVLEGITRKSVFDIAQAKNIEVRVQMVPLEHAYHADEIFMCTTAGGIMPITKLDGKPIRNGKVGPLTTKIWDEYWAMHYDPKYSSAIDYKGHEGN
ncbi:hypothetical protein AFLA_002755 [Aspergillus flavus NRRL3357]|nr:hypothetical protein AFLA_002755 [Aspergillus flavus NRRL3357]